MGARNPHDDVVDDDVDDEDADESVLDDADDDEPDDDDDDDELPVCAEAVADVLGEPIVGDPSGNTWMASCGGEGTSDFVWAFTPPRDARYRFSTYTNAFDTVLYFFDDSCTVEWICHDDIAMGDDLPAIYTTSFVDLSLFTGDTRAVVVDGAPGGVPIELVISIPDEPGDDCCEAGTCSSDAILDCVAGYDEACDGEAWDQPCINLAFAACNMLCD